MSMFCIRHFRQCHYPSGQSPASNREGLVSIPGKSMWDLWCTKGQWNRLFSEYIALSLLVPVQNCSVIIGLSTTVAHQCYQ